jgi:hypothetical protein
MRQLLNYVFDCVNRSSGRSSGDSIHNYERCWRSVADYS